MKKSFIFYCFLLLIVQIKNQVIIVPFKTVNPSKLIQDNYITELINNKIYLELKIGTPYQKIPVLLKLNQIPFFITSSSYNKDIIKFNSSKSETYTQSSEKDYISHDYDYNHAFLGEDIITIENISNHNSFLDRTQFYLATNLTENNENISGEIGLNIINTIFLSFINQLKRNKKIDDYIFSLKYITENEGEFHLGNYYHFYDDNFKESDFKSFGIGTRQSAFLDKWEIYFNKIMLSNGNLTFGDALLSYEFGFIYGTEHYHILIKQIFFDNYGNNCKKIIFGKNEFYYVCDKNINLEKFPDLIFVKDNINFTFTRNELWQEFENNYYFLVIFCEQPKEDWIFGKIFFKKYIIFFNLDQKIIGFYPNSNQQDSKSKDNIEKSNLNSYLLPWILVILLLIILIIFIIYFFYYLKIKNRKIRANELDDNYDYVSQENQNEPLSINK